MEVKLSLLMWWLPDNFFFLTERCIHSIILQTLFIIFVPLSPPCLYNDQWGWWSCSMKFKLFQTNWHTELGSINFLATSSTNVHELSFLIIDIRYVYSFLTHKGVLLTTCEQGLWVNQVNMSDGGKHVQMCADFYAQSKACGEDYSGCSFDRVKSDLTRICTEVVHLKLVKIQFYILNKCMSFVQVPSK